MFMGLEEPFEDGAAIPLTLIFEGAGELKVEVPVDLARLTQAADPAAGASGHDGHAGQGAAPGAAGHEGH